MTIGSTDITSTNIIEKQTKKEILYMLQNTPWTSLADNLHVKEERNKRKCWCQDFRTIARSIRTSSLHILWLPICQLRARRPRISRGTCNPQENTDYEAAGEHVLTVLKNRRLSSATTSSLQPTIMEDPHTTPSLTWQLE